jgi:hypothetical protein
MEFWEFALFLGQRVMFEMAALSIWNLPRKKADVPIAATTGPPRNECPFYR